MLPDYEKLGAFYLGRLKDSDETLLYDSKDLTTHAVCVGMTGSGKTGLCLGLLEEAAIDGIPALVIDPKGDLANLLLTFPDLAPEDFEPWVNPDEARNQGLAVPAFAAAEAEKWRKGLGQWGQDGARIQRLRDACEFAVYTPGSDAGIPVSILKSFDAPSQAILDDREALRDRVSSTATSLLALAGIDADPVQSREHILLSTILDTAWRAGASLDLATIIGQIQKPPFQRVGVLDLDSFYPAKERFGLAMALNNLLASPGFEAWLSGDPLDIDAMLWTPAGKPRISIFSIAHLSDTERMFFVSLLLNQALSWVRSQSGTSSLRALLYMDEIFGYFPPTANPPSKKPLLTLLKQARAFGLGVVLATQNPVDLDYKGLGNTGTWFIGRLQTERDKARVLEGLEGAAASSGAAFDRSAMERTLAGLGNRVFLLNNVHEDGPVLFQTRWTLSYLRGPLARPEIKRLMQGTPRAAAVAVDDVAGESTAVPVLPPDVNQLFVPLKGSVLEYEPRILGAARVQFSDAKLGVDEVRDCVFACPITDEAIPVDWPQAEALEVPLDELEKAPTDGATFAELPAIAAHAKNYTVWQKSFATWLYQNQTLELMRSPSTGEVSRIGEPERDFRLRIQQAAREARDEQTQDLRARYAPKIQTLSDRLQRAQLKLEQEKQQASAQTLSSVLSIGTSILGAFMGRKTISSANVNRIGTAARAATRIGKERGDVGLATDSVENVQAQLQALNQQLEEEIASIPEVANEEFGSVTVKPKKTGIQVQLISLVWM
ncbi:helicase HerA domain-containing protein [uncultured Paludibaculum sp.]|uniref:ATP-binding protein n=1 Tax=uncultured Paludibaculum sp. TaxID=1765020 RepID=UPI002AAC383D|nr:DUF87 domain-containing protein [uncultured Paludibaculum sp.]